MLIHIYLIFFFHFPFHLIGGKLSNIYITMYLNKAGTKAKIILFAPHGQVSHPKRNRREINAHKWVLWMLFSELFEQHFLVLVDFAHIWFFRSHSHTANNSHAACSMSEKQKINGEWTCSRSAKQILMFGYFFSSSYFFLTCVVKKLRKIFLFLPPVYYVVPSFHSF
jgi:hypothetical protein